MKCYSCNKEVEENLSYCPHCGTTMEAKTEIPEIDLTENTPRDIEEELQDYTVIDLSRDNNRGEYTNSLDVIDLTEEPDEQEEIEEPIQNDLEKTEDLSKITEITKPIIEVEQEDNIFTRKVEEEIKEEPKRKEQRIEEPLATKESVTKRKNTFFTISVIIIAIIVALLFYLMFRGGTSKTPNVDYVSKVNAAMDRYYKNGDTEGLQEIANGIKKEEEITNVQIKIKEVFTSWLDEFKSRDIENFDNYSSDIKAYKRFLKEIYELPQDGEKILSTEDYKTLSNEIDNISKDSASYIDALKYYQASSYNEAYFMFSKLDKNNTYYNKAQNYLTKIQTEVIKILKEDISKIEVGIDALTPEEKKNRDTQIATIINAYNNIYGNLKLSNNKEYQELLQKYQSTN